VYGDDDYLPLSALNDMLFCPRRCALHRLEGIWVENVHTTEGSLSHRRAHAGHGDDELEGAARVVRGFRLRSDRLRLVGVADVVELHPTPYPVEYKLKRRRRWDNDDVQLCAQALCLEEMLNTEVPRGAVYHVRSRRRREVVFDAGLRRETEEAVARLHELIRSGQTPAPVLHPKCKACSLHAVCLPELIAAPATYRRAADNLYRVNDDAGRQARPFPLA
jgi:CRISPR-associated exonuclease Cas4